MKISSVLTLLLVSIMAGLLFSFSDAVQIYRAIPVSAAEAEKHVESQQYISSIPRVPLILEYAAGSKIIPGLQRSCCFQCLSYCTCCYQ